MLKKGYSTDQALAMLHEGKVSKWKYQAQLKKEELEFEKYKFHENLKQKKQKIEQELKFMQMKIELAKGFLCIQKLICKILSTIESHLLLYVSWSNR